MKRVLCAGLTTGLLLWVAPAAFAAPTATFAGGTLTVTGEAVAETFTVSQAGANVQVSGPAGVNDPDMGGTDCTASGGIASCADSVVVNVVVNGGDGNDALTEARTVPSTDTDTLNGGNGLDALTFSGSATGNADVVLNGGADADTLTFSGSATSGSSVVLNGGAAADALTFSGSAFSSSDVQLNGGSENDTLSATTSGAVDLNGDAGDDALSGPAVGSNSMTLNGDAGNDTLTKNGAADLNGGDDNDAINAGTGSLFFESGGPGNDTFTGSAQQSDAFVGEPGSDTYIGGTRVPGPTEDPTNPNPATYQRFSAGDYITYGGRTDALTVTLDGVANDGSASEADNVGVDIEAVDGGLGNDVLTAAANAVELFGDDGDDTIAGSPTDDDLYGGQGSDAITAGAGDDRLYDGDSTDSFVNPGDPPAPAAGNDRLDGGPGDDDLSTDRGADDLVGGAGSDRAEFSRTVPQASTVMTPIAQAAFNISLDNVANDGVGGAAEGDNVHADVEEISTGGGADVVTGTAAAERFFTGNGNDTITPGAGTDDVFAGRGDDTISAVDLTTDRIECGAGADSAAVDLPGGQPERADFTLDCETITGQAFAALADVSKLVLVFRGSTVKSKTFLRNGILPLKVTCSKACALRGDAYSGKVGASLVGKLARGFGSLGLGTGERTLKVKIAKKYLKSYRKRLRTKNQKKKGLKFSVVVTASDALGITVRTTRTFTVKG